MAGLRGKRLGKYDIRSEIGRGGMGVVYRGYDTMLKRDVAIKVLPPQLSLDAQFVQRFEQEAVLAASLHHPNIVTIYDVGKQDGVQYIVMQYLEGQPLDHWLRRQRTLSPEQVADVTRQMADALDFAHSQSIIHRDVKPANIMMGADGHATLMDFGLVRAGEGSGLTKTGTIMGTPEYMSPEQALGQKVDHRSDIYSLGVVIYKLLSGKVPFERSSPYAVSYAHINEPPPPLRQFCPDLPPSLEAVVMKALAKRPGDRYQSAGALAGDFALAAAGALSVAPTVPSPTVARTAPVGGGATASSRRRLSTPLLAGLVVVIMTALAGILWGASNGWGATIPAPPATVGNPGTDPESATATPTRLKDSPTPTFTPAGPADSLTPTIVFTPTLIPPPPPTATPLPQSARIEVTSPTVNLRAGPDTNYAVVGQAQKGQTFDIFGRNDNSSWFQIMRLNGDIAWIVNDRQWTRVNGDLSSIEVAENIPKQPTCAKSPGPSFQRLWTRDRIGCAVNDEKGITSAYQEFENGFMLWRSDNNTFHVVNDDGSLWSTGNYPRSEPPDFACNQASQLGQPRRGFSMVWCDHESIRQSIGNAIGGEIGDIRPLQQFEDGFMVYIEERGPVYILYEDGRWESG